MGLDRDSRPLLTKSFHIGLKQTLKEGESVPAIYSDPLFRRSSNWVLSTSAVFSKHFGPYGWGEVVPEGFGVAYMTGFDGMFFIISFVFSSFMTKSPLDYLQYTITSRTGMPNGQFCKELEKASQDLYALHVDAAPSPKSLL